MVAVCIQRKTLKSRYPEINTNHAMSVMGQDCRRRLVKADFITPLPGIPF
jgi:hypothetical protein